MRCRAERDKVSVIGDPREVTGQHTVIIIEGNPDLVSQEISGFKAIELELIDPAGAKVIIMLELCASLQIDISQHEPICRHLVAVDDRWRTVGKKRGAEVGGAKPLFDGCGHRHKPMRRPNYPRPIDRAGQSRGRRLLKCSVKNPP